MPIATEATKFVCPECHTQAVRDEKTGQLSCSKCKIQPTTFIGSGYNLFTAGFDEEMKFPEDFPFNPKYYRHQDF
ncbi:MAG: hypothetical protein NTY33_01240 [Candidatus Moranbacteria bacterium]|nr:hypothetical protein [Candidatus Moranbacteria bacterium]